ncbi:MAG: 4-hydroxythreonine-4-phosphate dehydrogenase PdxA [Chitinispirillaceae bacterium]|jgi:4-hydroxythreonine-4-phosphate dehydrogenase|nr:4-hydroxythreonine-4-phosphate dehydrogenase PdxA [Chitinispirillaceae bacterium]
MNLSDSKSPLPVFALTMGDPAGIGPEIALKALARHEPARDYRVAIIGDLAVLKKTAISMHIQNDLSAVSDIREAGPDIIPVLDMKIISPEEFTIGKTSAACGRAAYAYIIKAIDLARQNIAAGVITNPINKISLSMAGINYPGHTEIFAHETHACGSAMLFYLDGIGVTHVTTHCSLRQAIDRITTERVFFHIKLLDKSMKQLGIAHPRLAVGGLNPHAGENGLFGDEELLVISPAIERARAEGFSVQGPFPPDTVFMRAFRSEFDGVVSMLHDHGFVALKSRNFELGVNITAGLPIIRTSVGHGTAFDIAGKGTASEASLIAAINAAWLLYKNK